MSEGLLGSALLASLQSCMEAFFLGLQVRCLPSVPAASIRCSSRPSQDSDRLQLHTGECGTGSSHPPLVRRSFLEGKGGRKEPRRRKDCPSLFLVGNIYFPAF